MSQLPPISAIATLSLLASLLSSQPALAQAAEDFYRGKTVTIAVGSATGGGYDAYARALQRFLPNHLSGKPTVIVANMPGAGSWNAVLHLERNAPTDGTVMTIFNAGIITETVTDPTNARRKLSEYAWIGSASRDIRTCYVWAGLGLKSWQDLKQPKGFSFGSTGVGSSAHNDIVVLHNLIGLNVRPILGYPGRSEVHIAIERGELDGECGSTASIPESWMKAGKAKMLIRMAALRTPEVPEDVPYIADLVSSAEDKAIIEVLTVANEVGRPFIVSKKVPADRLALLRAAFDATMTDPDYLAFTEKQSLPTMPIKGPEAEALVAHIYSVPAEVAAKARALITPAQ